MKTDTWMPLFIGDYLAATIGLSYEQHGRLLLLLMAYWRNQGPVPESTAAGILENHSETLSRFFQIHDGFWHHERTDNELLIAAANRQQKADAGRLGMASRWGNNHNGVITPLLQSNNDDHNTVITTPLRNDNPSPSPSPIPQDLLRTSDCPLYPNPHNVVLPLDHVPERHGKKQPNSQHPDALKILDHLIAESGRRFRPTISNLKFISARLNEDGVETPEILKMISRQAALWKNTDMEQYLRPETLFNQTKFDSYYASRDVPIKSQSSPATGGCRIDRNAGTFNAGTPSSIPAARALQKRRLAESLERLAPNPNPP